ncbi:MAG: hypothetical protein AAF614_18575 [Chloroflexota bacterium]
MKKFPNEDYAQDLYEHLRALAKGSINVSIEGAGVHWHCTAAQGDSRCVIHCFDNFGKGAEYYTSFQRSSEEKATARITSRNDTLAAVLAWLQGETVAQMYQQFLFVDKRKRELHQIQKDLFRYNPRLHSEAQSWLKHKRGDSYVLHFRTDDRSCKLSFYSKSEAPDFVFSWDDTALFEFRTKDYAQAAMVLTQWLCDKAQPSKMRREYPSLEIGELADYYEQGRPIEGDFLMSWDSIERFYNQYNLSKRNERLKVPADVFAFIKNLRAKGFDRTLRAGQSVDLFILSRSRRHGLRLEQPRLVFGFGEKSLYVQNLLDGWKKETNKMQFPEIKLVPEIEKLLDELESKSID